MADAMEMLSVALAAYGYAVPADVLRAACQRSGAVINMAASTSAAQHLSAHQQLSREASR
jgi:hypothetical protein